MEEKAAQGTRHFLLQRIAAQAGCSALQSPKAGPPQLGWRKKEAQECTLSGLGAAEALFLISGEAYSRQAVGMAMVGGGEGERGGEWGAQGDGRHHCRPPPPTRVLTAEQPFPQDLCGMDFRILLSPALWEVTAGWLRLTLERERESCLVGSQSWLCFSDLCVPGGVPLRLGS